MGRVQTRDKGWEVSEGSGESYFRVQDVSGCTTPRPDGEDKVKYSKKGSERRKVGGT